jgi:hypothetical protein
MQINPANCGADMENAAACAEGGEEVEAEEEEEGAEGAEEDEEDEEDDEEEEAEEEEEEEAEEEEAALGLVLCVFDGLGVCAAALPLSEASSGDDPPSSPAAVIS